MGARLDQHFLVDTRVRDAVAACADIGPQDDVLEIGPGRGMLTQALLRRPRQVVAVEKDERLAARLPEALEFPAHLRVIRADFLDIDMDSLGPGPWKVVANLPYAVATPILQRLLPWPHWQVAVLMFQKEVAERITAPPGGGDYGLLTLSTALHAEAEIVLEVPRESFAPRPKVASAVVRFHRRQAPLAPEPEQAAFFRVAHLAFSQRRKMAQGLLARGLGISRQNVAAAFLAEGIAPGARAQDIAFEGFQGLARRLILGGG